MEQTAVNETRQIGTVELLTPRIYNVDSSELVPKNFKTEIAVPPGKYPVYSDGWSHYWMVTGKITHRGMHRMGDGVFSTMDSDYVDVTSPDVTVPSKIFGPDEFADFLKNDPVCQPGLQQRLVFTLDSGDKE